jgi:alpha-mannosidase
MKRLLMAIVLVLAWAMLGAVFAPPKDDPNYRMGKDKERFYLHLYESQLKKDGFKPTDLNTFSIGQSHIDAAWRWRLIQTHKKCLRTFGKAIYHMEKYPFFTYSQSAPQYYEWVKQEDPALFAKIQAAVKAGRWEIVGGQWIEPDGNMPAGESYVRQRLYGQRFYLENFGRISDFEWMLDSFGYNWNLPQIMKKSGAKYMWTSKLTWNDTTIFPYHLFWWEGVDGSRLLTHICPISPFPAYFPYNELKKFKDTRYLLPAGTSFTADYATDPAQIKAMRSTDWMNVTAIVYGLGDGGLGPIEKEVLIQKAMADKGWTRFGTAHQLFAELEKYQDRIPVWKDEMYLETHRGVQTTHAWIKRANRESESLLRSAEVVRTFAAKLGLSYPGPDLLATWKLVLLYQFHDILPGSSIPEVYEDIRPSYAAIKTSVTGLIDDGLKSLVAAVDTRPKSAEPELVPVVVTNTLGWSRSGLAELKLSAGENFKVLDGELKEVPAETWEANAGRTLVFRAEAVPALGYRVFYLKPGTPSGQGPAAKDEGAQIVLENELVKVAVDKSTGWLTSVLDKQTGKELLQGNGNQLLAFHDRPKKYSAWNIDADYIAHPLSVPQAQSVKIENTTPLAVEVSVSRRFKNTKVRQFIRLVQGDPRVYLDWDLDFHEVDTLFKQGFETSLKSEKLTAEIAYAVIEYPTHPQTPAQQAQFEKPCQKWIDLSDGAEGLALLNNGKYGFSINPQGTGYRLSLIRGAHFPKANPGAENVHHHMWSPIPRFEYTDQGKNYFETALLPHAGDWRRAKLWRAGYEFNTPLLATRADQHQGKLPAAGSFLTIEGDDVYLGAIKRAEDDNDLVIRLVEAAGRNSPVVLKFQNGWKPTGAAETDLLEMDPKPLAVKGNDLALTLTPFEIKTVKITLK